ncbi:6745_t:CDS:2 [Diversispora eburnea]|uniref:6745_t:CDS:1 n=1 Tax=Diversispora eburnea TaxID=1213867 RepID=A0A9N8YVK2_9GLOM|nr:6745_t:CDS:2 [Diversispora eburnea]
MDPSLYQQRQQQNRVPYPFPGNPQAGSANVMGTGIYSPQYLPANMTNNTGYLQSSNINPMMPTSGRPVYPVPVASMTSMTTNGMPAAKRVALAPNPQMQSMFSNITQNPGQNQLFATASGFPNQQQMMNSGRSVPTQSFVNTDQSIEGKTPIPMQSNNYASSPNINKYYGQFQQPTPTKANPIGNMGSNFNNLLNQSQSSHSQQPNQAIQNSMPQDESQVDWLELGDDEDIVYDFNCSTDATGNLGGNWNANPLQGNLNYPSQSKSYATINQNELGYNFSNISPISSSSSNVSQNLSPKEIQHNSIGMLSSRSPNPNPINISSNLVDESNSASVIYNQNQSINLNQTTQTVSQIGQYNKIPSKDHLASNSMIRGYSQQSAQSSSISPEIPSSTSNIQNTVIDPYKQTSSSQAVDSSTLTSNKSNTIIGHIDPMQQITSSQENQADSSIMPVSENQNAYTNPQISNNMSRVPSSTISPPKTEKSPSVPSPQSQSPNPNTTTPISPPKNTTPRPQKVNYCPKIRRVESYGGYDMKAFENFSIPLHLPAIQDLVDIHALTMSLKCGMKLEVANALNTLTTLSHYQIQDENTISQRKFKSYKQLYQLVKQECDGFSEVAYGKSFASEEWLPLHEQCWCTINMIRNFSFMNENHEHLASHPRLLYVLMRTLYVGEDDGSNEIIKVISKTDENGERMILKRAYDVLELRKSVLIILSNIAAYLQLPSINIAKDLLVIIIDFLDCSDDYYAQVALEVFSKISVSYENRLRIGGCDEETLTMAFERLAKMLNLRESSFGLGIGGVTRPSMNNLSFLATLVMACFNFASLSGESMRKKMISTPGFISRMLKLSTTLANIRGNNNDEDCLMLARRAMEMLKVLAKGNEESFLVYTSQLLEALLTPYIDPVVIKDLEAVIYPGDV